MFDKAMFLGFVILELSKQRMYETYYSIMLPFSATKLEGNLQLHYMDSDFSKFNVKTDDLIRNLIKSQGEKICFILKKLLTITHYDVTGIWINW